MARLLWLHLCQGYGGAERLTEALVPALAREHELLFLTNHPELFALEGLTPCPFPGPAFFSSPAAAWHQIQALRALLRPGDQVLAVMHYGAFLATLAARLKRPRPRVVSALHGPIRPALWTVLRPQRRPLLLAARLLIRLSDTLIVPSHGLKQELVVSFGQPRHRVVVVPNGLPPWSETPKTPRGPKDPLRLLWMGRLAPEKAPERVLYALAELKDLPWHLTLLGQGAEEARLRKLAEDLGLTPRLQWPGFQKDVRPFLQEADIFLHTCLFEGFGLSILEAMACGCAVVAEDCPYGPREVLDHGRYGTLVNSLAGLKEALHRLLTRKDLLQEAQERARQRARDFPLSRTLKGYQEVLKKGP